MEQDLVYVICGWIASISMVLGYLPQAIQTIRTRNTDGISLPAFLLMSVGGIAFMLQGLLHEPEVLWSLFLTNLVTTTCSCIVFGIKIYNDYVKDSGQKRASDIERKLKERFGEETHVTLHTEPTKDK